MPPQSVSTVGEQQQRFTLDSLRLYSFDKTELDMLSFTHRVATQLEKKSQRKRILVPRSGENLTATPATAVWCKACRTKGHRSPAFSGSCNSRRLQKERNVAQAPRCDEQPRAKAKRCVKSARERQIISASDGHMCRVAQDPSPFYEPCDGVESISGIQICSKTEVRSPRACPLPQHLAYKSCLRDDALGAPA